MKFSIITPEHDPGNVPFLVELYNTIQAQTYTNWEWVIYLNGNATFECIPAEIKSNPKVRLFKTDDPNKNIGFIKHQAFMLGKGDVLVEVDHDDLITPDCLEELYNAYQDPAIGFVYSDDAMLHMTDTFVPYDESQNWTWKPFEWQGQELVAMNSFEPSSHSIGYIWFAPDHVRSWRTSVYHAIGGHHSDYSICDDHELMIRTYLNTTMKRVPKVLYIYRITGNNTFIERNEAIQETTVQLFHQNIRRLAEKDASKQGLLCVDIGGGLNPVSGYITIDQRDTAHIQADLNKRFPLGDNTVGVLNASHILEHLDDPIHTMQEIHRVLAHGGWAFIEVPSTDGRGAFQDPTHVSFWNENSFWYYTNKNFAQYIGNETIRFQEYYKETVFPDEFSRQHNIPVTRVYLVAIKHDAVKFPGLQEI